MNYWLILVIPLYYRLDGGFAESMRGHKIRSLFPTAGKIGKIKKTLFFIPGPFEDEDTVTPFNVVTNASAAAVNTTVYSFWTPFFDNVISTKIDDRIETVESKINLTEAKGDVKIALRRIPFSAIWGRGSFNESLPADGEEFGFV